MSVHRPPQWHSRQTTNVVRIDTHRVTAMDRPHHGGYADGGFVPPAPAAAEASTELGLDDDAGADGASYRAWRRVRLLEFALVGFVLAVAALGALVLAWPALRALLRH